jgi:hypothetical protein
MADNTSFKKDVNDIATNLEAYNKTITDNSAYLYFKPDVSQIKSTDTRKCFSKPEYRTNQPDPMIQIPGRHSGETCKLNAAAYLAKKQWDSNFVSDISDLTSTTSRVNFSRSREIKDPGLDFKVVNGYFNDNVNFFNTAGLLSLGKTRNFTNITTSTNSYITAPNSNQHFYSVEWTGFFIPDKTGIWNFYIDSDDASYLWLGDNAQNGYSSTNANINNGRPHGMEKRSCSMSVVKDQKYPIRLQFGEQGGGHNFIFTLKDPDNLERSDYVNFLFTLSTEDASINGQLDSFSLNKSVYYSLKDNGSCYVNDPASTAQSSPNNYRYFTILSTQQPTSSGNANNTGSISARLSINNGNVTFTSNGNVRDFGSSNGIIYLDNNGSFYIQDRSGSDVRVLTNPYDRDRFIVNYQWADYRYQNNVTDRLDLKNGAKSDINKAILISDNNKYKLEIDDVGNLIVKATMQGCLTNDGASLKTTSSNLDDYYLYKVDVDKKWDKIFFAQVDGNKKTLQYIEKENPALVLGDTYLKLSSGLAPTPVEMTKERQVGTTVEDCKKNCTDDKTCKYFYRYTKNDNKNYCLNMNDSYTPGNYTPVQPNSGIVNVSDLYIRELKVKLDPTDFRSIPEHRNLTNFRPYSETEVNPYVLISDPFTKSNVDGDINCSFVSPLVLQSIYYTGLENADPDTRKVYERCKDKFREGFNDHSYQKKEDVYRSYGSGNPQGIGLPEAVSKYQVDPLKQIANDYINKETTVDKNYRDITDNISKITNVNRTGIRDDMSGNYLYDYNTPFTLNKPKTTLDGLVSDNRQLEAQGNAVYILGTITAATLVIFAIILAKE